MPGFRPKASGKASGKAPTKSAGKLHGAGNCGTGKGGFRPGNTCGKSGRAKLAADIRAARSKAHQGTKLDRQALHYDVKQLKHHRRGKEGSVADAHAKEIRDSLRGHGKSASAKPKEVARPANESRKATDPHPTPEHHDPSGPLPGTDPSLLAHKNWVEGMDRLKHEAADYYAKPLGKTGKQFLDEVSDGFGEAVRSGDHYVRVSPGVLKRVVAEGRFKTQFETRTSNGHYEEGSTKRATVEEDKFAVPRSVDPALRPIYGYVGGKDFSTMHTHEQGVNPYGEVAVKLKDHVRDRSTVTSLDSLEASVVGARATRPDYLAISTRDLKGIHEAVTAKGAAGHEKLLRVLDKTEFIEAQHFGGLHVRDIAEVGFQSPPDARMKGILDRAGIPYRVVPARKS